jgi:hypothetical protein
VFIFFEEIEKGRPDLVDAVHFVPPVLQSRSLAPRDSAFHAKKRGAISPRCLRRSCRRATRCPLKHFPFERKSAPRSRLTDHNRPSLYTGHSSHSEVRSSTHPSNFSGLSQKSNAEHWSGADDIATSANASVPGSKRYGMRYRWAVRATLSPTGSAAISATVIVA